MEHKLYLYSSKNNHIMATIDLREAVKQYINTADIRLLKMIKALAESYQNDQQETFTLSEQAYQMLDKRRASHLNNESTSFTWEQVQQNARKAAQ